MGLAVHHGDLPRTRQVHINARTAFLELERFRVCVQFCFRDLLSVRVHLSERSAAESDIHPLACGIVPQVVGVVAVLDGLEEVKRASVEHLDGSVLAARDEQSILARDVECALRFLQPRDRVCAFAGFEVDDFESVVAESRNKQPLASNVDRHVVDTALYIRHFYRLLQLQGSRRLPHCNCR